MSRVFPPHAYSDAPRNACFWAETVPEMAHPTAVGQITTDIAIIGGGFTGLSAALHLAQDGHDVAVLEGKTIGWGASGRNGGFCCLGGFGAPDGLLARLHGEDARREARQAESAAIDLVEALTQTHAIDVNRHSNGETVMGFSARSLAYFETESRQVEDDLGLTPTIIQNHELAQNGMTGPFHCGMTIPKGFGLNPAKLAQGMARAATDAGARIYSQSPVKRIDHDTGFTLTTPQAIINAKQIIIATNGYSSDDLPAWLRARYLPAQSNVIVTRPLTDDEIAAQGWSTRQMSYDERFFLHYFRLMPDNRFLFGMRGGLFSSPAADARMHRTIRAHFERMFPAWAHVETPHSWNGMLSLSRDLTPYAGPVPEMPGAWTALSYQGNGVAMGTYAGALLADQISGQARRLNPQIMQTPPRRFPLGPLRRTWLWPAYGWAMLTGG